MLKIRGGLGCGLGCGLGQGGGEACLHAVEPGEGAGIGTLERLAAEVDGGDELDLLANVVEGEHLVEEEERRVGDAELVRGGRGEALDLAHDVVAEETDGSGGKGRKPGKDGGPVTAEGVLEGGEDVAFALAAGGGGAAALVNDEVTAARDDALIGLDADEGVASDALAALDGFEQKGLGFAGGETQEGTDGGFEVGDDAAGDGNQGVSAGEVLELGPAWGCPGRLRGGRPAGRCCGLVRVGHNRASRGVFHDDSSSYVR